MAARPRYVFPFAWRERPAMAAPRAISALACGDAAADDVAATRMRSWRATGLGWCWRLRPWARLPPGEDRAMAAWGAADFWWLSTRHRRISRGAESAWWVYTRDGRDLRRMRRPVKTAAIDRPLLSFAFIAPPTVPVRAFPPRSRAWVTGEFRKYFAATTPQQRFLPRITMAPPMAAALICDFSMGRASCRWWWARARHVGFQSLISRQELGRQYRRRLLLSFAGRGATLAAYLIICRPPWRRRHGYYTISCQYALRYYYHRKEHWAHKRAMSSAALADDEFFLSHNLLHDRERTTRRQPSSACQRAVHDIDDDDIAAWDGAQLPAISIYFVYLGKMMLARDEGCAYIAFSRLYFSFRWFLSRIRRE